ncbi:MAG: hypothetical protein WCA08_12520 [Desulfoferrobacter sp.]
MIHGSLAMKPHGFRSYLVRTLPPRKYGTGVPPVPSYGTYTDTGRFADLLAAVSAALGGVPIPDLSMVAVAPECMEQKATIDTVFALALCLYTCLNPIPAVIGAPNLVRLLTQ